MLQGIRTLGDLFDKRKDDARAITVFKTDQDKECLSYQELYARAGGVLKMLQQQQMRPQQELIIYLEDPCSFMTVFWAGMLGGIIPVPLSVGRTYEQHLKLFLVYETLTDPRVITTRVTWEKLQKTLPLERLAQLQQIEPVFIEDSTASSAVVVPYTALEDDIAYVQFSSGSTNAPKGVALTHKNILTNCKAILANIDSPPAGDLFFSWMPLTHDMGLIGYHITPFLAGWDHYIMSTELFIRKPARWLELVSLHRVTFTASPNFGYTCVLKYLQHYSLVNTDLSSVRIITNGAEPISAELCRQFERELSMYGLKPNTIFPVYGLAEAGLAVTFTRPGAAVKTIVIDRAYTGEKDRIKEVPAEQGVEFVNVGQPLKDNCALRIVSGNVLLDEKVIGQIEIKGNNVTSRYYNNATATAETITPEGWLKTGDLGFIKDGSLFITGRSKDIFFVNGQNFYPHDIEAALEQHPQLRAGRIAVAGSFNTVAARDEVLLFIKNAGKSSGFQAMADELKMMMNKKFGIVPDFIVPVNEIPKTTSGKVQRYKLVSEFRHAQERDRHAADEMQADTTTQQAATTETVTVLTRIWKEILSTGTITPVQDFFSIGGTSLLAAQMLSLAGDELGKEISLAEFYEHTTIAELAALFDAHPLKTVHTGNTVAVQQTYPLSSDQERLYYHWELDRQSIAYNMPVAIEMRGPLALNKLEDAIRSLLQQYKILSATLLKGEPPTLNIQEIPAFSLICADAREENINSLLRQSVKPFNLLEDILYRVKLFRISADRHILFADFHHIVADGYSLAVFFNQLLTAYQGLPLQSSEVYGDMLQWLAQKRRDENTATFWHSYLQKGLPQVHLPLDLIRPAVFSPVGKKTAFALDASLKKNVAAFAQANALSPYMIYLAAFKIFLSKLSGQEEVATGLAVSLRELAWQQGSVGMFTNSLVMRSHPAGTQQVQDFLRSFGSDLRKVMANKTYPVINALNEASKDRDLSRNTGFDTMFIYQDFDLDNSTGSELSCKKYFFDPGTSKYDLSLEIFDKDPCFYIEYATSLFNQNSIEHFAAYYKAVLKGLCSPVTKYISEIDVLSPEEKDDFLNGYNNTAAAYSSDATVLTLIKQQVLLSGQHTAVKDGAMELSFAALDQQAERLAHALQKKGIRQNEPVVIYLQRSAAFIIATLAVWKAGGCFVPLDTTSPSSRIQYILDDCKARVIITDSVLQGDIDILAAGRSILLADSDHPVAGKEKCMEPAPADTAYIIYTSGTTGDPKGVVVAHQSFTNYISWAVKQYINEERPAFAFFTSVAFDLTLTSVFAPLVYGGTVIVFREEDDSLPVQMVVKDPAVAIFKATPSHLRLLAASNELNDHFEHSNIRCIIIGGEVLNTALAKEIHDLFKGRARLFNEYGPTEATVGCMTHLYDPLLDKAVSVPIGIPIANTSVFLLDACQQPVPYNVAGELYIAGDGLAGEYLEQPGLTAEKFIPHLSITGQKMYKTGDHARRLYSGLLEYTGRKDKQVKIKGYRIELNEIEEMLGRHPGVEQAIVIVKNAGTDLAAYIVPARDSDQLPEQLRTYLQAMLPVYSLPRYYTIIQSIPLTANGKLDEAALPEPVAITQHAHSLAEPSRIEAHIAAVWQDILKVTSISVTDNFYWLGGDSIKAVQIASRLRDAGIHITAREIMLYPVIRELVQHASFAGPLLAEQREVTGGKNLSPIEHWFFSQQFYNPAYYNQTVVLQFKRDVDTAIINRAFRLLVEHHDGLRLNDNAGHGMMLRPAYDDTLLQVEKIYCSKEEWPIAGAALKQTFTITDGPLIKMVILNQDDGNHLFITAHHLVIDGFSWRILLEDFYRLYTSLAAGEQPLLPLKTVSLLKYQSALEQLQQDETLNNEELFFWRRMELPVPCISSDNVPGLTAKGAGSHTAILDTEETEALWAVASEGQHITIETILITALARVLKEWNDSELVKIELEHHGRDVLDVDVSRTVGWFTSIYPVILRLASEQASEQLQEIREQLNTIPRKGLGYGVLKYLGNKLAKEKDKPTVRFNYLGRFDDELNNDLFVYAEAFTGPDMDPKNKPGCPLEFNCYGVDGRFKLEIIYDRSCLLAETVELFTQEYIDALKELLNSISSVDNRSFSLSDLDTCELDEGDLQHLFN